MFCKSGAYFIGIMVECKYTFRLASVIQALVCEQFAGGGLRVIRPVSEDVRRVERELLKIVGELYDCVVGLLHPRVYVLEHTGSGAGGRYKLAFSLYLRAVRISGGGFGLCFA